MKLRVLALTNMYPTPEDPAFGAFVASQMNSIAEAGHSVEIDRIEGRRGVAAYPRAIARVRALARSGSFDLVHAHYGLSGFVASFQPLPFVVSFCGDDLLGTPAPGGGITMKSRLSRSLSRHAATRAAAIICKSAELRDALPRSQDRARARVIPNGVDLRLFRPGDRLDARRKLNLDPGELLILFPHTPEERRKRVDLARAAVDLLVKSGRPARLLIVSGRRPDEMPDFYQAADCLLLTSDWEGSPNVVKEALCCDLPVVSVNAGDVREWLDLAGYSVVERNPAAIAAALARIPRGPAKGSGERIRSRLALPTIAAEIEAVYRDMPLTLSRD